jgi:hypothetical protein
MYTEIDSLKKLNQLATLRKHMIEFKVDNWIVFEPSRFIFAFFAFNSFYNIDWERTMSSSSISYYNSTDNDEEVSDLKVKSKNIINKIDPNDLILLNNYFGKDLKLLDRYEVSEIKKIKNIAKFVYSYIISSDEILNRFVSNIKGKDTTESLILKLDKIVPDNRIKINKIENFKSSLKKLYNYEIIELDEFNNILIGS